MNSHISFRTGKGRSIAQHGELFQGQVQDVQDRRRRCLLSLPCKALHTDAIFCPDTSGAVSVRPSHKLKAQKAAELTLAYLNAVGVGGVLTIESTIPAAKGYGSSTADCVAAAMATADGLTRTLREEELARLVVEAEVASDSLMFSQTVLFAHREGVAIESYACDLPKFDILGIDTAKESYVHTLEYPPAVYSWRQLQSFCTLTGAIRRAIRSNDGKLLACVATASAQINEQFLPKPMFKEVREIASDAGALGVAAAHSGTVLSILLDSTDVRLEYKTEKISNALSRLGISTLLRFQT